MPRSRITSGIADGSVYKHTHGRGRQVLSPDRLDGTLLKNGAIVALYRLYIGVADGASVARVWARRYSK